MAKRATKKDIEEVIALCLKKLFHDEDITIEVARKWVTFDSVYIKISESGKYSLWDRVRFNYYLRRYTGKNLICKFWDKEKNELIIQNEYDVIED